MVGQCLADGVVPLYVLRLIEDIQTSPVWQIYKKNQQMAWGMGMERRPLDMVTDFVLISDQTANDFVKQVQKKVFAFLEVSEGPSAELCQLYCTLYSYAVCHPDPFLVSGSFR
jgi:hypothetical protein